MGAIGKGKAPVATQIPEDYAGLMKARGGRLEWTVSKTAARIIEMWVEAGAPALSDADRALPTLSLKEYLASKEKGYGVKVQPKPEILHPKTKVSKKGAA